MKRSNRGLEVSLIIPTYNRSRLLDYSLLSLMHQDIEKSRFEVIVADDGSADDSRKVVEKYGKSGGRDRIQDYGPALLDLKIKQMH